MTDYLIARYGEISLKGNNRAQFEKILVTNMKQALHAYPDVRLERTGGRILVSLHGAPANDVTALLAKVFGLVSLSPVAIVKPDLTEVIDAAVQWMSYYLNAHQTQYASDGQPTFKIEAKRTNKRFPLQSPQIAQTVGAAVLEKLPHWRVDVHNPDVTVYVEIHTENGIVYYDRTAAVGGLPVGASGRVGLLLSGGIDSPVAGWFAMKRGAEVEAIHFHSFPFTSERALQKVETLAQSLADWGGHVVLHTVHFTEVQTEIHKHCNDALGITVMRRMMLRIAAEIARKRRLFAIVTGESLGQVASQTLESMFVINNVTNLPVLRPLIGADKTEIIDRARAIGTYDTSILPYEDCCTVFVPKKPRTRPHLEEAEAEEAKLDVAQLLARAVENTTMKTFYARTED